MRIEEHSEAFASALSGTGRRRWVSPASRCPPWPETRALQGRDRRFPIGRRDPADGGVGTAGGAIPQTRGIDARLQKQLRPHDAGDERAKARRTRPRRRVSIGPNRSRGAGSECRSAGPRPQDGDSARSRPGKPHVDDRALGAVGAREGRVDRRRQGRVRARKRDRARIRNTLFCRLVAAPPADHPGPQNEGDESDQNERHEEQHPETRTFQHGFFLLARKPARRTGACMPGDGRRGRSEGRRFMYGRQVGSVYQARTKWRCHGTS